MNGNNILAARGSHEVLLIGQDSEWLAFISGMQHESVLGQVPIELYVSNVNRIKTNFKSKTVNDTEVGGKVLTTAVYGNIHKYLVNINHWSEKW